MITLQNCDLKKKGSILSKRGEILFYCKDHNYGNGGSEQSKSTINSFDTAETVVTQLRLLISRNCKAVHFD